MHVSQTYSRPRYLYSIVPQIEVYAFNHKVVTQLFASECLRISLHLPLLLFRCTFLSLLIFSQHLILQKNRHLLLFNFWLSQFELPQLLFYMFHLCLSLTVSIFARINLPIVDHPFIIDSLLGE